MSKAKLAVRLADELGTTTAKAQRFISDVGASRARRLMNSTGGGATVHVGSYWKPVVTTGGLAGAGGLAWRQQDIQKLKAETEAARTDLEVLQALAENEDLSAEQKSALTEELMRRLAGGGGGGGDDGDGSDPFDLDSSFKNVQLTLGLVIVAVIALKFA